MATQRDIKRRINAVDNIKQITRAMYMVAASRLRRAEDQVHQARPYAAALSNVLGRLAGEGKSVTHPLLTERDVKKVTYVLITGDRGLCGSYNANIMRAMELVLRKEDREYELVAVGRKGRDYFRRRGIPIVREFTNVGEEITYDQAREIAQYLSERFLAGDSDQVIIYFTEFISALSQRVRSLQLLPISTSAFEQEETPEPEGERPDHFYEPSTDRLFEELLPKYTQNQAYQALMESKASEQGARMTAMKNATENAEELTESLTLEFNRARQAAITKEISEIVGGAEAINQG